MAQTLAQMGAKWGPKCWPPTNESNKNRARPRGRAMRKQGKQRLPNRKKPVPNGYQNNCQQFCCIRRNSLPIDSITRVLFVSPIPCLCLSSHCNNKSYKKAVMWVIVLSAAAAASRRASGSLCLVRSGMTSLLTPFERLRILPKQLIAI